jgi:hypothetical protein
MLRSTRESLVALAFLFPIWTVTASAQDCDSQTTCGDCVLVYPCGWCSYEDANGTPQARCRIGDASGPEGPGACASWQWEPSNECSVGHAQTYTYYADADGDGYGDPNSPITSTNPTPPAGYVSDQTDADDTDSSVHTEQTYTYYRDADGDGYGDPDSATTSSSDAPPSGYVSDDTDSDDANPSVHPGATFTYYRDADGDGYGDPGSATTSTSPTPPAGYVADHTDSDDADPAVHTGGGGTVPCPLTFTALLTFTLVGLLRSRPPKHSR